MTDPQPLFPVDQTPDTVCPVCAAVRAAGEPKTSQYAYEKHRDGRRPAGCLNAHDPRYADLPF